MPPFRNTPEETVRVHCDVHHRAVELGYSAVRLIANGLAAITCPGAPDKDDAHFIEIDAEFVPFRIDVTSAGTASEGSGAAPSRMAS